MNPIEVGNWASLYWLWIVVACSVIVSLSLLWKRRVRARFAKVETYDRIFPRSIGHHTFRGLIVLAAMSMLVVAMVDLRWGISQQDVPQQGIEVMFLLDVSRSMLASDVTPNRLERAKQMIKDMVDEMSGDRVGLTLFAGEVRRHVPMTNHYTDFKQALDEVGPENVNRGGSRLGDAITVASSGFLEQANQHKTLVLLTDGEDQESEPVKAASEAHHLGIRIFTIGIGDEKTGSRIPLRSEPDDQGKSEPGRFLNHEGEQVWSKLDGRILSEIGRASGGIYVPAGTKRVNTANIYHRYIANVEKTTFDSVRINRREPRFQWFVLPAILLLVTESLWDFSGTSRQRI